jgi:hypothetical protein
MNGGRGMADVSGDVAAFTQHRGHLLGLAYRMLGTVADARGCGSKTRGCAGPLWMNRRVTDRGPRGWGASR